MPAYPGTHTIVASPVELTKSVGYPTLTFPNGRQGPGSVQKGPDRVFEGSLQHACYLAGPSRQIITSKLIQAGCLSIPRPL